MSTKFLARRPRRRLAGLALAALLLTVSACGGSDSGSDGDQVTLRFSWWGSDARHQATQKAIDAFQASHPNIKIKGEFGEWTGYWDKLATTVAANDAPDIIQMDEKYLREYADRGALLDFKKDGSVDTSKIEPTALGAGEFSGGLFGISAGINSFALMANPALFKSLGVAMPDDKTWTWDQYADLSAQLTAKSGGKVFGSGIATNEAGLAVWARQHGQSLFNAEGKIGVQPDVVTDWFKFQKKLLDSKGIPPAAINAQNMTIPLEQGYMVTKKQAMGYTWSNQLSANAKAAGQDFVLLRLPSSAGKAAENGAYYKASMFWSVSSRSKHPKEAAEFVNFLANSKEAADILLAERGVPPNTALRADVTPKLNPAETTVVKFIEAIQPELAAAPAPPPVGGGNVEKMMQRYTTEVLFDRLSPEDASSQFLKELEGAINK
ncbi:extracellular solute-binding protein [Kribbella sp. NBC_01245]|uniref:ABC transporter substrate-binding protein n=1 Tax=Kribbella sp. NBC_01245 TaxID=2903578 RepID=UPI002E2B5710|nr:extracellular solute-binding protein [Kribbella sp. NBC_01245]